MMTDDESTGEAPEVSPLNHPLFNIGNLLLAREIAALYGEWVMVSRITSDLRAIEEARAEQAGEEVNLGRFMFPFGDVPAAWSAH